ncbi:MAG: glycoside hydrolase family 32 protein [Cyclobacteriaceae bacterium]|nr:glycoside hydrolase family 32 protein [Cyclobacteriaceae bacterium]
MKWLIPVFLIIILSCSKKETGIVTNDSTQYSERYRPQYHFSPDKNWTNDPNGLVYYEGEYHIFYQYNPYGNTWGHMSWGHAVSKDLLHWEQLPVAIAEYQNPSGDSTMIFSGTVVVDKNNSSGFCEGKDCLIAVYTSHVHKDGQGKLQHQSLAYSNDKGRTWKRYDKNPVLDIQRKDFRDPKIFWYETGNVWIAAMVVPDLFKVVFYKSTNLKEWTALGEFGGIGDTSKIWECPDLFELPVEGEPGKTKWILSLSGSHPAGGKFVGMQYFVGVFNGNTFIPDQSTQAPLYMDFGKDFYAGIIYNNIPKEDGRTIMIGWANNWAYGNQIPTSTWRSAMALPRELSLKKTAAGLRLIQQPLKTISSLRGDEMKGEISGNQLELEVEIDIAKSKGAGIKILKSESEETIIGYDATTQEVFIDRTHSGDVGFHKEFASIDRVKIDASTGKIKLQVFVDHSIVEVFVNNGEQTLCEQVFPLANDARVIPYSENNDGVISVRAWKINRTWK